MKDIKQTWHTVTANYSHWLSFLLLMVVAVIVNPSFLSFTNLTNQFVQGAIVGICAMGMSLVISAGMIDLSVGSAVALISGLGVTLLNRTQSILLCLAFCLVFGLLLGLFNGIFITKGNIAPFIVTLATFSAYRSIINQLGQGGPFTVDKSLYDSFRSIAAGRLLGIPNLMVFFIIVSLVTGFIMSKTKFGRYVYAIGSNQQAARLTGIKVGRVKTLIYCYAGILYGLAAFLLASRLTSIQAASAGDGYEMDAIAAVAIGGTAMEGGRGKIMGTFLGVLMLRIIQTILVMANVPPFLSGLVRGIVILVAVLAQTRKKSR
ncbi:MAG: ABC transporter permease [Lacrimispora sp.]|uniref:ABC transporter permease n=1 Tax=Lacrimispora sp. TaxID=2719234 RepID=UPI0039E3EFB5